MAKKVYFAFHYQDVIDFRANVVRKHNFTKGVEAAGYYDYSIWEESKKKGDLALKRMINAELEGTSVTAVLIGTSTFSRRWVQYEIFKSVERGNRVLGIHINSIGGKDSLTKGLGPNPFDHLGLQISEDGKRAARLYGTVKSGFILRMSSRISLAPSNLRIMASSCSSRIGLRRMTGLRTTASTTLTIGSPK